VRVAASTEQLAVQLDLTIGWETHRPPPEEVAFRSFGIGRRAVGELKQPALGFLQDFGLRPVVMEERLADDAPLSPLGHGVVVVGLSESPKVTNLGGVIGCFLVVGWGGEKGPV